MDFNQFNLNKGDVFNFGEVVRPIVIVAKTRQEAQAYAKEHHIKGYTYASSGDAIAGLHNPAVHFLKDYKFHPKIQEIMDALAGCGWKKGNYETYVI